MGGRLTVVGAEDVLDEDGLLVVGQVRQELTEGLGGVQLAHWLHYSHHVNLRCLAQAFLNILHHSVLSEMNCLHRGKCDNNKEQDL